MRKFKGQTATWTWASLFHGTERNGTDQFRVLFDGTEQRWNGKISALVCACTFCYSSEVVDYLKDPPAEQVNSIPPVEPKAGEMYLFQGSGIKKGKCTLEGLHARAYGY